MHCHPGRDHTQIEPLLLSDLPTATNLPCRLSNLSGLSAVLQEHSKAAQGAVLCELRAGAQHQSESAAGLYQVSLAVLKSLWRVASKVTSSGHNVERKMRTQRCLCQSEKHTFNQSRWTAANLSADIWNFLWEWCSWGFFCLGLVFFFKHCQLIH